MREDIITATFVSARGEAIKWDIAGPHVLVRLDGISGLTAQVTTSRTPGQDGELWRASYLPVRTITLNGAVCGEGAELAANRAWLMRVTNPRLGPGLLTVQGLGRSRQIEAWVDAAPVLNESAGLPWQTYAMTLTCPCPYWEDVQVSTLALRRQSGGLRFPLQLPTHFALVNTTREFLARNLGDADCPLTMEFAGSAINPVLTNVTTGEAIRINTTIPDGHTLVVSTAHGGKRALLRNDSTGQTTDAMMYLDLSSVFFMLRAGDNYLSYNADEGASGAIVTARWRTRWAGI